MLAVHTDLGEFMRYMLPNSDFEEAPNAEFADDPANDMRMKVILAPKEDEHFDFERAEAIFSAERTDGFLTFAVVTKPYTREKVRSALTEFELF